MLAPSRFSKSAVTGTRAAENPCAADFLHVSFYSITLSPVDHKNLPQLLNTFNLSDSNEPHLPAPIDDLADDVKLLAGATELVFEELHGLGAGDDDHAYAQVERA